MCFAFVITKSDRALVDLDPKNENKDEEEPLSRRGGALEFSVNIN